MGQKSAENVLEGIKASKTRPLWRFLTALGIRHVGSQSAQILAERFPAAEWNLYLFHFTDGENYSRQDTERCLQLLAEQLLPSLNLLGYGQVESYGTSGDFYEALESRFGDDERLALSSIPNRDGVVDSIKTFLGRGR